MNLSTGERVLQGLLDTNKDYSTLAWQPFHSGVDIYELYPQADDGAHAALLRYHPGANVPQHVHSGFEHLLILQGSQCDEQGEYTAGTLVINRPGTSHHVFSEHGCILLAIWQRPVQFVDTPV